MKVIFSDKSTSYFNENVLSMLISDVGEAFTEAEEERFKNSDSVNFKTLFKFCKKKGVPVSLLFSEISTVNSHLISYNNKINEKFNPDLGNVFYGTRSNKGNEGKVISGRKLLLKYLVYKQEYLKKNKNDNQNRLLGLLVSHVNETTGNISEVVSKELLIDDWRIQKGNKEKRLKLLVKNLLKKDIFISESSANNYMPEKLDEDDTYSGFVLVDDCFPWIFINSKEYILNKNTGAYIIESYGRQILTIVYLCVYFFLFKKRA